MGWAAPLVGWMAHLNQSWVRTWKCWHYKECWCGTDFLVIMSKYRWWISEKWVQHSTDTHVKPSSFLLQTIKLHRYTCMYAYEYPSMHTLSTYCMSVCLLIFVFFFVFVFGSYLLWLWIPLIGTKEQKITQMHSHRHG